MKFCNVAMNFDVKSNYVSCSTKETSNTRVAKSMKRKLQTETMKGGENMTNKKKGWVWSVSCSDANGI